MICAILGDIHDMMRYMFDMCRDTTIYVEMDDIWRDQGAGCIAPVQSREQKDDGVSTLMLLTEHVSQRPEGVPNLTSATCVVLDGMGTYGDKDPFTMVKLVLPVHM